MYYTSLKYILFSHTMKITRTIEQLSYLHTKKLIMIHSFCWKYIFVQFGIKLYIYNGVHKRIIILVLCTKKAKFGLTFRR